MKSKFLSWNLKAIAVAISFCGFMTSCYEKEDIDTPVLGDPVYVISGELISAATGTAVPGNVLINNVSYATNSDGFFTANVSNSGTYTVTANISGYQPATRTVMLPQVSNGQVSSAFIDIYLFSNTTPTVTPESDAPATTTETTSATQSVTNSLTSLVTSDPLTGATINSGDITSSVLEAGKSQVTIPVKLNVPSSGPISVPYYHFTGFSSTITPNDPNGQAWIEMAEKYLNMKYGLNRQDPNPTQLISTFSGYSITGYDVTTTYVSRTLVFNVNGTPVTGTIAYEQSTTIMPTYESHDTHDSHDSHDGHGGNPGAGGGSGE